MLLSEPCGALTVQYLKGNFLINVVGNRKVYYTELEKNVPKERGGAYEGAHIRQPAEYNRSSAEI